MMERRLFTRGELARGLGCSLKAIRVYEARGLVVPCARGRRRFDDGAVDRLRLVLALRQIGLSLERIGAFLAQRANPAETPAAAAARLADGMGEAVRHVTELIERCLRVRQELITSRETLLRCSECAGTHEDCRGCAASGKLGPIERTLLLTPAAR